MEIYNGRAHSPPYTYRSPFSPLSVAAAAAADGAQQQRASAASSSSPPTTKGGGGGGGSSGAGSGSGMLSEVEAIALRQRRARFREHCDAWAGALCQCAARVWHLQGVLHKQVDAVTNERFLDVLLRSGAWGV